MKRKRRTMRLLSVLIAVALCCTSVDCSGLGIREVVAAGVQQPDSDEQQTPMEGNPEEKDPEEGDPEEGDLEEGDPEEKAPGEKDPEEKDPEEGNPEEKDPEEGSPEEKDPEEGDPEEKDPEEGDPEEKDPEEGNPEEKAPGEKDPEEKDPEEGNPEEKDPEEGNPEEKNPGEGDPEEKNPGEGDPEEKDPEEGNPEEKDPGEENPDGDQEEGEEIYVLSVEKDGVVITISNRDGSAFPPGVTAEVTAYGEDSDVQTLQDELLYSYAEAYMKEHEEEGWEEEREENLELLKEALRQGLGNSLICRISLYDADGNPYEAGNICQTVSIPDSFWQNSSASRDAFWYDSGLSQKAVGSLEETGDGIRVTFDGNVREYFAVFELDCEKIFGEISQMVLLSGSEESKLVHHFILKDGKTDSQIGGVSYALFTDEACQNAVMDKGGQPVAGVTSDAEESRIENVEPEETEDYYIEFTNLPKGYREGDSFVVQCAWKGSEDAAEEYIVTPWKAAELTVYVNDSSQNNVLLSGFTVELFEWSKDASAYGTDSIAVLADNGDGTYSLPKQLRKNEDGSEEEIEDRLTESAENEGKFLIRDTACAEGYEPGTEVEICITDPGYTGEVVLEKAQKYGNLLEILADPSTAQISIRKKDQDGADDGKIIAMAPEGERDPDNWITDPVSADTEFYILIENMAVDETKVENNRIYTMGLPDDLVPQLEEAEGSSLFEEWTILEKVGNVPAYGRILELASAEDEVKYQFQVYFENTEGYSGILFGFQYNASLNEKYQDGGEVTVKYETGHELSFEVEPKVSGDFIIEKSAVWTRSEDHEDRTEDNTISGNVKYDQVEYTITITNNGDPEVPVNFNLEEILPEDMVIWQDMKYAYDTKFDGNVEMKMMTGDGTEAAFSMVTCFPASTNTVRMPFMAMTEEKPVLMVDLSWDPELSYKTDYIMTKFNVGTWTPLAFKTLTITYRAYPYYGTSTGYEQKQRNDYYADRDFVYRADTTLTAADGKEYEASAAAVKTLGEIKGVYTNSGGTYNRYPSSNSTYRNYKVGKIRFSSNNVDSGGERWFQFSEEPLGTDFEYGGSASGFGSVWDGASWNYFFNAEDFMLHKVIHTGSSGTSTSYEGGKLSDSVQISWNGTELNDSNMEIVSIDDIQQDILLWHELTTLFADAGYDIKDYIASSNDSARIPVYQYSYTDDFGNSKRLYIVVSPETFEAAKLVCSTMYAKDFNAFVPLEDLMTGKPLGIKLYVLGIQGDTLSFSYDKYQRSLTPNASNLNELLLNGYKLWWDRNYGDQYGYYNPLYVFSGIFSRNRSFQGYTVSGTQDFGVPDTPMLTKEGELLEDGSIKWTLTLDVTRLEYYYENVRYLSGGATGLWLFDQPPEGYSMTGGSFYDEDFHSPSRYSESVKYFSGVLYLQKSNGEYTELKGVVFSNKSAYKKKWKPEILGDDFSAYAEICDLSALKQNSYDAAGKRIIRLMYITAPDSSGGSAYNGNAQLLANKAEVAVANYPEEYSSASWPTNPSRNRLYDVAAAGTVVLPSLLTKTMEQDETAENRWNVHAESNTTASTYKENNWFYSIPSRYLNGVYSVKDNMRESTVNDESGDVSKYIELEELCVTVTGKNGFSSELSLAGMSGTEQIDGSILYQQKLSGARSVELRYTPVKEEIGEADECGMYGGFELAVHGLTDAQKIELDYAISFDYEAYLEDHAGLGTLNLKLKNSLSRNYEKLKRDTAVLTATQSSFSMAVRPAIIKKLLAPDMDKNIDDLSTYGGYHKYQVVADIGASNQQSVYLVDQVYAAVEKRLTGYDEVNGEYVTVEKKYTPEQIALLMQYMRINDFKIVAGNRLNNSAEETVYENGQAADGWSVDSVAQEALSAIGVPEEGVALDGNLFRYLVSRSDGSQIPKETYFTITYSIQLDPEKVIEGKNFRELDFYEGGVISMSSQAAVGYPVFAGSGAMLSRNVQWAAAGAMVEDVIYLEYKRAVKDILEETNDSTTWALGGIFYTAGKQNTTGMQLGDFLNITALDVEDDGINEKLVELLVEHLTVSEVKAYYITDQYQSDDSNKIELKLMQTDQFSGEMIFRDGEGRTVIVTPRTTYRYVKPQDGETVGHGEHTLFEVSATGFPYQEKFWVEYTTVVDWNAIFEKAYELGIISYDEAARIAYRMWNEAKGEDVREVTEKNWSYPAEYSGSISKKAKAGEEKDSIDWTVSLHIGKSAFDNFKLEDILRADESGSNADNNKKALASMSVKSLSIVDGEQKELYVYGGSFAVGTKADLPDIEGVWSDASLRFTAAGFEMEFGTLMAENDLEFRYTTVLDGEKFLQAGGDLTKKIEIDNAVTGAAGSMKISGEAAGSIMPDPETKVVKEHSQDGTLNENCWKVTASVGNYDAESLKIEDNLSSADIETIKKYLSVSSMKITLITAGQEEVIYDSDENKDVLEDNHFRFEDGFQLNQNGIYSFALHFEGSREKGFLLVKGTEVRIEYTTVLDRTAYLLNEQGDGSFTLRNEALLEREGSVSRNAVAEGTAEIIREPMRKEGWQSGYDADGNAIVKWEMNIFLTAEYSKAKLKSSSSVTVSDLLPYGLTYVDGSIKLYTLKKTNGIYEKDRVISPDQYLVEYVGRRVNIRLINPEEIEKFAIELETVASASISDLTNNVQISVDGKKVSTVSTPIEEIFVKHQSGYVKSTQKLGNVILTKTDADQNELAGAEFELRDAAGNAIGLTKDDKGYHFDGEAEEDKLIHTLVTDAGGDILIDGLPYGTYSLVETKQPSGYQKPSETEATYGFTIDDRLFTKNSDGTYTARTVEISAVNKPVKVIVKKVFAETVQGKEYSGDVKGAKLEIWDKAKKNKFAEWTTDGEEEGHEVKCLVPGDYVLVESSAPDGFLTAQEIPFTIDEDGALRMKGEAVVDDTVTMRDKAVYGKIILNKEGEVLKDLGVKEVAGGLLHTFEWIFGKLENVTFAIFAEEDIRIQDTVVFKKDQKIGTIYTGVDGIATMEGLLPGRYYAREISNADGNYKVDSMTRFSLVLSYKDSDTPIVVAEDTVLNERHKAEVQLIKTDADDGGKPVAGAVYGLYAAEDNRILKKDELLAKAVTDETGKAAFAVDLPVGNYYVKELESPDGYLLNEAVSTIEFTKESKFSLQVTDTARKLRIGKVDPDGKPVSGALLQLLNADGKEIDSWMSGEDYHEICAVAPGNYTLREKKAPEGYETAGDMEIVVKEKDSVVAVNMVDVPAESEEPTQEETETEETETEETTPEETPEETTQPSPTESVPEEPRKPSGEELPSGGEEQPGEDQASDSSGEEPAVTVSRTAQPETVEESAETESAELSGTEIPSTGTGDKAPVEAAAATLLFSLIVILVLMRKKRESNGDIEK